MGPKLPADTVMDVTHNDVHHNGSCEWGLLRNVLYHRTKSYPRPRWIRTKRVSFTPKRIMLLASMLAVNPNPTPRENTMMTNLGIELTDDQRDALASLIDGKDTTRLATRKEITAIAQSHISGLARAAEAQVFEDVEDDDRDAALQGAIEGAPANDLYVVDHTDPLTRTMAHPDNPSYVRGWNQVKT